MAGNLVQDPETEKCSYFVLKTVEVATFYCHIWPFSRFVWRWFPVFLVQILCEILPLLELAPVRTSPAVTYWFGQTRAKNSLSLVNNLVDATRLQTALWANSPCRSRKDQRIWYWLCILLASGLWYKNATQLGLHPVCESAGEIIRCEQIKCYILHACVASNYSCM